MSGQSPWLSLREAARYLRVGTETLAAAAGRGEVPSYFDPTLRLGGVSSRRQMFDARELDEWMRAGRRCAR